MSPSSTSLVFRGLRSKRTRMTWVTRSRRETSAARSPGPCVSYLSLHSIQQTAATQILHPCSGRRISGARFRSGGSRRMAWISSPGLSWICTRSGEVCLTMLTPICARTYVPLPVLSDCLVAVLTQHGDSEGSCFGIKAGQPSSSITSCLTRNNGVISAPC